MKVQADKRAASTPHHDSPGHDLKAIVPKADDTLLLDGDFNNIGSGVVLTGPWTVGDNWEVIVSPFPTHPPTYGIQHTPGSTDSVSQDDLPIIANNYYRVTYTVINLTAGTVLVSLGVNGSSNSTNETFTEILRPTSDSDRSLVFTPSSDFDGFIYNISLVWLHTGDSGALVNGDFSSGSNWTLTSNAEIATGTLHLNPVGSVSKASQDVGAVDNTLYVVTFTLASVTAGEVQVILHRTIDGSASNNSDGSYTLAFVTGPNTTLIYPVGGMSDGELTFQMSTAFDGTIDDVSLFGLITGSPNLLADLTFDFGSDSDWTKEAGWTIGSGVATCDGTDGARIYQNLNLIKDRHYFIQYDVTARSAGSVTAELGGTAGNAQSAVGTYMEVIKVGGTDATHATNVSFLSTDFNGSIDNVEVYLVLGIPLDERRVFERIDYSYDAAPDADAGMVSIVGKDGILWERDVATLGAGHEDFHDFIHEGLGDATVAVLQQGGSGIEGKLNASIR